MRKAKELREWLDKIPDDWAISINGLEIRSYPNKSFEWQHPACFDLYEPAEDIEPESRKDKVNA